MHFCLDDSPRFQMIELDQVTSTNDFLRAYRPIKERWLTLVTAEFQTAGRGSGVNHWESERGKNLVFSLLTYPRHVASQDMFMLSEALALAIHEALGTFILQPSSFTIKWPNDIYWNDLKVCGMLIENDLQGAHVERCVMGVGVNINQTEFRSDAPNPISLAQIMGHEVERRFVLEHIMECFTRYYEWTEQGRAAELHTLYLSHLYRKGELHTFHDELGDFRGTIEDVEPTGHLIIADETGRNRRYAFKEVNYILTP
mgnify:FL=1